MKKQLTQSLAILLNLTLVGSSFADIGMPGNAASAAMPDFVKTLTPPTALGYLTDSYKGNTDHPVILIQDLHANYGVQKKIEGLLKFLQPKVSPKGSPMVLGIEGAWGQMNLTNVRSSALKVRQIAADFLLKEAEISGMEHFAAMSPVPVDFYGIDNPQDYIIHQNLFRKSLAARLELAGKIDQLRIVVNKSKADGPRSLRHLWKLADNFHAGKIGLDELSNALGTRLSDYGQAEAALSDAQTAAAGLEKGEKAFYMKNVVAADQDLSMLSRLFRQQLTFEEVQYVSKRVSKMLVVIQALLPKENMKLWEDTVRSAIDHYAVALLRNQPMASHAKELAAQNPGKSVVLVTGGFHTAGIAESLKAKKISYIVVAPVVDSHTAKDERLYIKRMMGIRVSSSEEAKELAQIKATAHTITPGGDVAAAGMLLAGTPLTADMRAAASHWPEVIGRVEHGDEAAGTDQPLTNAERGIDEAAVVESKSAGESPTSLAGRIGVKVERQLDIIADNDQPGQGPIAKEGDKVTDVSLADEKPREAGRVTGVAKIAGLLGVAAAGATVLKVVNMAGQSGHQFTNALSVANNSSAMTVALNAGHSFLTSIGSAMHSPHAGWWIAGAAAVTVGTAIAARKAINGAA